MLAIDGGTGGFGYIYVHTLMGLMSTTYLLVLIEK